MSKNLDYLFLKIKDIYKSFEIPEGIDYKAWEEVIAQSPAEDLMIALKEYRKEDEYNRSPNPAKFKKYLPSPIAEKKAPKNIKIFDLPSQLMKEDNEAEKNLEFFYRHYQEAVEYILNHELKEFSTLPLNQRINMAREKGYFNNIRPYLILSKERKLK